jgi:hypothetical protein
VDEVPADHDRLDLLGAVAFQQLAERLGENVLVVPRLYLRTLSLLVIDLLPSRARAKVEIGNMEDRADQPISKFPDRNSRIVCAIGCGFSAIAARAPRGSP